MSHGFLPKELPPTITSIRLASIARSLNGSKKKTYEPVRYSIARAGGLRRDAEIPHPFAQARITALCSAHWKQLQRRTAKSQISLSRPIRETRESDFDRSLRMRHGRTHDAHVLSRLVGNRYTLKTDISMFYPSIYTHAVDWAVRGKNAAKRDRFKNCLGSNLDTALRNSRHGQTVGISVGPDTSALISEVVLSRVDERLQDLHPGIAQSAFRFVDDMTVYCRTQDQAHEILNDYQRALSEYGLTLNAHKVRISHGLELRDSTWVRGLRSARMRDDTDSHLASDVIDLFAAAFEYAREFPQDGVLSYAIRRCDPFPSGNDSWPYYRDLVLAAVTQEPSSLPNAYAVLQFARTHGLATNADVIAETFNELCLDHAPKNHGFEVSWAMSILRELGLPLSVEAARLISKMDDNVSLVLLADTVNRWSSLRNNGFLDHAASRAEKRGALSGQDWLLAYEYRHRGECSPSAWDRDPTWRSMHLAKVGFVSDLDPKSRLAMRRRRPRFLPRWGYST